RPPSEIYFESRGKCCKKLLRYNGYPNKVLLYPEEGWARSAASSYWTIAPCRWRRNRCIVEEVAGSRKHDTEALKLPSERANGSLAFVSICVKNSIHSVEAQAPSGHEPSKPRPKETHRLAPSSSPPGGCSGGGPSSAVIGRQGALYLSSNISLADYNMGYCLTGTLERGCERTNQYQTTHFAVIRRCWPSNEHDGHH
ncbi:AGAP011720-PA, partial [Anopheles gambiae str. PEST]